MLELICKAIQFMFGFAVVAICLGWTLRSHRKPKG